MTTKYKNIIMEKIRESGSISDKTLAKSIAKDGYNMPDDLFNKTLLDIEIMGLVTVNWITKDTRRIEVIAVREEEDEVEVQNKKMLEKDYENSFPESNNNT